MDLKKDISVSKFLLPISVAMMTTGFILWFISVFSILNLSSFFRNNGYMMGILMMILLYLGFVIFIVGLIDQSISRKRSKIKQQDRSLSSTNQLWVTAGVMVIILFVIFAAFIIIGLSNING